MYIYKHLRNFLRENNGSDDPKCFQCRFLNNPRSSCDNLLSFRLSSYALNRI